jgi:hypothetical protein
MCLGMANGGKQVANDGKKVFTDKEIIKALECYSCMEDGLHEQALDLINRQQAEIERLSEALEIHKGIAEDWKYEAKKLKEMVGEQE